MGMPFLSIVTLTNYDDSLWDGLVVPSYEEYKDGLFTEHSLDKTLLISSICMECSDLQLIYPDWDYMFGLIAMWSETELPVWTKLYKTTMFEYNPLWNVDADITESSSGSNSGTTGGSNTESVAGYNSSTMVAHTKDDTSGSSSGSWSETHTTRRTGNIGVTSSQELLERERSVAQFNIYKYIVDSFKKRFCILVY